MTNCCMSITKDLLLYFIKCNYDEWLYEYYEGLLYFIEYNYDECLYEYYEGSIVIFILIINYYEWLDE